MLATANASSLATNLSVLKHYERLEKSFNVVVRSSKTTYKSPVNFIESMKYPRHRWFPYKEGFSPSFVNDFLGNSQRKSDCIFDPFSGSGTTPIVAGERGVEGVGFDVSPLTTFLGRAKSISLSRSEIANLRETIRCFVDDALDEVTEKPGHPTVVRYFEPDYLDALLRVKAFGSKLDNPRIAMLFKLAFLSAVEPFSTHRKAGNGVKRKTRLRYMGASGSPLQLIRNFVTERLRMFLSDLETSKAFRPPRLEVASSLDEAAYGGLNRISCLLTSPPYANCFDYSKIYMSELWLGDFFRSADDQARFRQTSVRSHVHARWDDRYQSLGSAYVDSEIRGYLSKQELWSDRIGSMLSGYFQDLGMLLSVVKNRVEPGGKLGFVVGNSFYGGIAVATDLLLAELGRAHGYKVESVQVFRSVIGSSQQYKIADGSKQYMRESLVVLQKI